MAEVRTARADRRIMPLWLHQGAEYAMGLLLAYMALHVKGQMETALLVAAGAMIATEVLTDGPAGAVRLLGPRAHQVVDLALVVGLALSPLAVPGHLDTLGIVVAEAAAVVLARMVTITRYRGRVSGPPAGPDGWDVRGGLSPPGQTSGGHATTHLTRQGGSVPGARSAATARTARGLGFLAGRGQQAGRRQAPRADRAMSEGAHRLGSWLARQGTQPGPPASPPGPGTGQGQPPESQP